MASTKLNIGDRRTTSVYCVLAVGALLLSACVNQIGQQATTGNYSGISQQSKKTDYASLSAETHYNVCQALLATQQMSKLDDCLAPLWNRADSETFTFRGVGTLSKDYVLIYLHDLETQKYLELGDLDQAYYHAEKAMEAARGNPKIVLNQALSIFTSITTLGLNNPSADDSFTSRKTREQAVIEPLGLMAIVQTLRGNPDEAEKFRAKLHESYAKAGKLNLEKETSLIRRWLAEAYYVAGDYEQAYLISTRDDRTGAQKAFDAVSSLTLFVAKPLMEPLSFAMAGTNFDDLRFVEEFPKQIMLYRSAFKSGRLDIARAGYDELLANERLPNFARFHFRLLHERAKLALAERDDAAAEALMRQAIGLLESQRAKMKTESYKIGFVGDKLAIYGDMASLLIRRGRTAEAFEFAERAKARALVDLLASRQTFAARGNAADTKKLLSELRALDQRSLAVGAKAGSKGKTRSASYERIGERLRSAAPELASLVTVDKVSVADIQSRLAADDALVEYFLSGDALVAFVVTRNAVSSVSLDSADLVNVVARFRRDVQSVRSRRYVRSGKVLHDRLIEPLAPLLDAKRLTIVPHGALHYVPFAALYDGERFLIDRFDIRLLPSASVLAYLGKSTAPDDRLLALANPDLGDPAMDLPGAQEETRVISSSWADSSILLRRNATEANFKKYAPTARFLHLASHGKFDADDPLKSRMLLAPGGGEDGNLTTDELYDLQLNAELVTLSACETAMGDVANGDDVIGLTRGFLYAGADSIVASLWPVSDEATAYLMQRFYGNLKTMDRAKALRSAGVATKAKYPHPYYWSAFQITGSAG